MADFYFIKNYYTSKLTTTVLPATASPLSTGVIDLVASTLVINTGVAYLVLLIVQNLLHQEKQFLILCEQVTLIHFLKS